MPSSPIIKRPTRARRRNLLNLADVVDHVLRVEEVNPDERRSVERAVIAAKSAVRNFVSHSTSGFRYYDSRDHLVFNPTYSVGEVTAASSVLTPTVAPTWPSWIAFGTIQLGDSQYVVLDSDATTVTIDEGVSDGVYQNVKLDHAYVQLPSSFRRRGSLADGTQSYPIIDVPQGVLQSWSTYYDLARSAGNTRVFGAITGDQRFQGELMLAVWPPFQATKTLSLYYERYPELCETHRYGSGTVTVVGDSTTATASSGIFTEDHVGSMLVVGTDGEAEIRSSLSSQDLAQYKRIITGFTSSTVVTIDSVLSSSDVTARAFYISDVIDVQPGPQVDAVLRLAEYEFSRQSKSKSASQRFAEFRLQMDIAMADDSRYRDIIDQQSSFDGAYGIGSVESRPT